MMMTRKKIFTKYLLIGSSIFILIILSISICVHQKNEKYFRSIENFILEQIKGEKGSNRILPSYIPISPNGQWTISDINITSEVINAKINKVDNPADFFTIQVSNYLVIRYSEWSPNSENISLGLSHLMPNKRGCLLIDVVTYRYEKGQWIGPTIYPSSARIPTKDCLFSFWSDNSESIFILPRVPDKNGNIPIEKINTIGQLQNYYLIKTDIPNHIDNYDSYGNNLYINNIGDEIFIKFDHEINTDISTDYYYFSSNDPDNVVHLFHFDGLCDLIGMDQNEKVYFSRIPSLDLEKSILLIYDLKTQKIIANTTVDMRVAPPGNTLLYPIHNKFVLESKDKIYFLDIHNMKLTNMGDIYTVIGWNTKLKGYLTLKENEEGELYLSLLKP